MVIIYSTKLFNIELVKLILLLLHPILTITAISPRWSLSPFPMVAVQERFNRSVVMQDSVCACRHYFNSKVGWKRFHACTPYTLVDQNNHCFTADATSMPNLGEQERLPQKQCNLYKSSLIVAQSAYNSHEKTQGTPYQ